MLLQRMRNEPSVLPHGEWANKQDPTGDTWVAAVMALQRRRNIPDIILQPGHRFELTKAARGRLFKKYKEEIVQPAADRQHGRKLDARPLPWGWITLCITSSEHMTAFQKWWAWKTRGHPHLTRENVCPACAHNEEPTAHHITWVCPTAKILANQNNINVRYLFHSPEGPQDFISKLTTVTLIVKGGKCSRSTGGPAHP